MDNVIEERHKLNQDYNKKMLFDIEQLRLVLTDEPTDKGFV